MVLSDVVVGADAAAQSEARPQVEAEGVVGVLGLAVAQLSANLVLPRLTVL